MHRPVIVGASASHGFDELNPCLAGLIRWRRGGERHYRAGIRARIERPERIKQRHRPAAALTPRRQHTQFLREIVIAKRRSKTVANRDLSTGYSILTLLEDIAQLPKLLAHGPIGQLSSQGLIEQSLSTEQTSHHAEITQAEIAYE